MEKQIYVIIYKIYIIYLEEVIVYRVVASQTRDRGEVVWMDTYEVLSLLFLGGSFLIALLAYIDRNNKRK